MLRQSTSLFRRALGKVRRSFAKAGRNITKTSHGDSDSPSESPATELEQFQQRVFQTWDLSGDDVVIYSLFGLGDTFLVLSLIEEFRTRHVPGRVIVVLKSAHEAITSLFDDGEIEFRFVDREEAGQINAIFARNARDNIMAPGRVYGLHPSMFTGFTLDNIYHIEQFSQLDMYKQLLHLPLACQPRFYSQAPWPTQDEWCPRPVQNILLCPFANSFPPPPAAFWVALAKRLVGEGLQVDINGFDSADGKQFPEVAGTNRLVMPLDELFSKCRHYDWVIGSLTGLMNVLCSAGSPNFKTFVIWDDESGVFKFNPSTHRASAFPYAYQTKYDGLLHNCDHVVVSASTTGESCERILSGLDLLRSAGTPTTRSVPFYAPTNPGDILDRLSIARVKSMRLDGVRKLVAEREVEYFDNVVDELLRNASCRQDLLDCLEDLVQLNDRAWASNEQIYQTFEQTEWAGTLSPERDWETIRSAFGNMALSQSLNRERVAIKNQCSTLVGNTFVEVKSFQDPWRARQSAEPQEQAKAA